MRRGYLFLTTLLFGGILSAQSDVTLILNTSTNGSGITDSSIIVVRGAFNGWANGAGEDTLDLIGGDYWSVTLSLTDATYEYKFAYYDDLGGNNWAGDPNESITVAGSAITKEHFWGPSSSPLTATSDIDVWFRVNMAGDVSFDTSTGTVFVRGNTAPLTWDATTVELTQEGTSFYYSGQASFTTAGTAVEYKFFGNDYEGISGNRSFTPNVDTTLAWRWFSDEPKLAAVDTFDVNLILNISTMQDITDSTATMWVSGTFNSWDHFGADSLSYGSGDYMTRSIQLIGDPAGIDLEYTHQWRSHSLPDDNWESVNALHTVSSDTTLLHYWKNIVPFTATDSLDVWFRVNMEGDATFDNSTDSVSVRGNTAPLTWDETTIKLTQEGSSYYYSGQASFANSVAGNAVNYKFFANSYEDFSGDRTFTPNADTTLAWRWFSNIAATGKVSVTANVVFTVDIGAQETMGIFSVERKDTMEVRGGFNSWGGDLVLPDKSNLRMDRLTGTTFFQKTIPVTQFVDSDQEYKYFILLSQASIDAFALIDSNFADWWGWELPGRVGGANRKFVFEGDPSASQNLDIGYYGGIEAAGVIPSGTSIDVTFTVDTRDASLDATPYYNPATDSIYFRFEDKWQQHVLGYVTENNARDRLLMTPTTANDSIYTITLALAGPAAYGFIYNYEYGNSTDGIVAEGSGFEFGRFRSRFVDPASIEPTVWPTTYDTPIDTLDKDPPHPVEVPPVLSTVGVDDNIAAVPNAFRVEQNFPNPFNPSTEIRFTLPMADVVTFTVYNLLGQRVAHLTQEFPGAGRYSFIWHGITDRGHKVASGVYFYQVRTSEKAITKKMTLLK